MSVMNLSSVQAGTDLSVLDLAEYTSVEGFMKKVFHQSKSNEARPSTSASVPAKLDDFDRTSSLIEEASKAIETLSSRCEILEAELGQERSICVEQSNHIDMLSAVLQEMKAKAVAFENEVKAVKLQNQAAETRIAELEQHHKVVTLRASKAESISSKLQQQVEAAFGYGSPIRSVMEAVNLQGAAE